MPRVLVQDLIERLRKELSGNFEHAMISLLLTPAEFDAKVPATAIVRESMCALELELHCKSLT